MFFFLIGVVSMFSVGRLILYIYFIFLFSKYVLSILSVMYLSVWIR